MDDRHPKRLPSADRRQQILNTAAALFMERGFEAVSMADVAEALAIARPTVYSYFPSTTAILEVLFNAGLDRLWQRLSPLIQARQQVRDMKSIVAIFTVLVEEREAIMLLNSGGGPIFQQQRVALGRRIAALIEPYSPDHRRPYTLTIQTLLLESMAYWTITNGPQDFQPVAENLAAFVHYGLEGGGALPPAGSVGRDDPEETRS